MTKYHGKVIDGIKYGEEFSWKNIELKVAIYRTRSNRFSPLAPACNVNFETMSYYYHTIVLNEFTFPCWSMFSDIRLASLSWVQPYNDIEKQLRSFIALMQRPNLVDNSRVKIDHPIFKHLWQEIEDSWTAAFFAGAFKLENRFPNLWEEYLNESELRR